MTDAFKLPPFPKLPDFESVSAALQPWAGVELPMDAWTRLQSQYLEQATTLWNEALQKDAAAAPLKDRRFADKAWSEDQGAHFLAQLYLLNARTLSEMAEAVQGDAKARARIKFAVQQMVDAAAPSNYLALNPEAQRLALESGGESIAKGLQLLWADVRRGKLSQTDDSAFEVGKNVATSAGSVVFENEYFQLLEYKPLTKEVHEKPFLIVPPFINKFYILDLQPENSLIRYAVENGHRTFVMSWRNPDESCAGWTWDELVENAPLKAIEVVLAIAGSKQLNTLGFCVGGTILSTALAVLAARGQQPAASLTLLTTLLDFENTGILDIFVDEQSVQLREMTLGDKAPKGPGLLKGSELAQTFSFLRPNDLVWNYVVGNYLKGETPPPFDLLYWNSDSTNLPGPMYTWYLRNTYLENNLVKPGHCTVCGEKVDLSKVDIPVFIYGSREDHIVPIGGAYASVKHLPGKKRFVMGASGHIAGVINPPAKNKRSYWTNDKLPATFDAWQKGATEHAGSWWPDWAAWLKAHAGKQIPAPKSYGKGTKYKAIEAAPGRYVKVKA